MSTVKFINDLDDTLCPLFEQYDSQCKPQEAFLSIDREDGECKFGVNWEIGNAVPFSVWHGVVLRIPVKPNVKREALLELINDEEFISKLQKLVDGSEVIWDGSNHVGRYTEDAEEECEDIESEIRDILHELDQADVWDAGNWLGNNDLSDWVNEGESLEDAASRIVDEAESEGTMLFYSDILSVLREKKEDEESEDDSEDE